MSSSQLRIVVGLAGWLVWAASHYAQAELPPVLQWHKILGSNQEDDFALGLAIDEAGNSVIVGQTQGALFRPSPYYFDGFYASYDLSGNLRWGQQLGRFPYLLKFNDVVAMPFGKWAIVGTANYSIGAQFGLDTTHYGGSDVVLVGLKSDGFVEWMTQVGTPTTDYGQAIAASAFDVIYAGDTYGSLAGENAGGNDVFEGRYTPPVFSIEGRHSNQGQFGTDDWDIVNDKVLGFVTGETFGSFDGGTNNSTDAFLARTDINGQPLWTRQYGDTRAQGADAVVADGDNAVYIAGYTYTNVGSNISNGPDAFLAKYDYAGNFQWERVVSSDDSISPGNLEKTDRFEALAIDGMGNVYVAGNVDEEVTTPSTSPAVISKYSPAGDLLWTQQLELNLTHRVSGLAVDDSGTRFWVAGTAYGPGSLGDPDFADAFLAYFESPYPAGDYDYDGLVTGSDFLMWQSGQVGEGPSRDFLDYWKANYGTSEPSSLALQRAVPEPSAMLLCWGSFLFWAARRSR